MLRFLPMACILLTAGAAHATCTTPSFPLKDGTGAAATGSAVATAAGDCVFPSTIADGVAGANRAAVKAASTPAAATDPSLVVSVSPNNAVGIVDSGGTNKATVKAASTSPVAADPALVVALSPNSAGLGCAGTTIANTKSLPIQVTTATNTQLFSGGGAGTQTYICSIQIFTAIANNVALVEGSGTTCGTGTLGVAGGASAATGWNFSANSGLTLGNGQGVIMRTATTASNNNICLFVSSVGPVSGNIVYAQY